MDPFVRVAGKIMDIVFKMALNNHEIAPAEPADVLKAWVLYEHAGLCNRALLCLHRVAANLEGAGQMACAIMRLDLLEDPRLSKALAREAQAADIIVVATQAGWELTEAFKDWISRWLSTKTERPTTLALVLDARQSRDRDGRGVAFHLAEVARLGGVDFISTEGGQPVADIEGPLTQALTQRNRSTSRALQMT
jgi:hypothetical protein